MKDRLKQIRSELNISQQKLADNLGVSVSNIQSYELGRRTPSDAFVKLLCGKYNIREEWIRSGEGEMHFPLDREGEIAKIADQMLEETEPSIKNALIKIVAEMSDDELEIFLRYAKELVAEMEK